MTARDDYRYVDGDETWEAMCDGVRRKFWSRRIEVWTNRFDDGRSTHWRGHVRFWRIQIGGALMRHHYGTHTSDRWVFQTSSHYDRKPATTPPVPAGGPYTVNTPTDSPEPEKRK